MSEQKFDVVIIDVAAQETDPSCLIPLMLNSQQYILSGDAKQLPETVFSSGRVKVSLRLSLFERMN